MTPQRSLLGLDAPSAAVAVPTALGCAIAIALQLGVLANLALYEPAWPQTALGGALVLAQAALVSAARVAGALAVALAVVSLLLVATLRRPAASRQARRVLTLLANAPVMMLLPIWLVAVGNSEQAGFAFLVYCMSAMLGFTVFEDAGGAAHARRLVESLPLAWPRRLGLVGETVVTSMRQSIFQILVLGLPLALAAELITNKNGLGFLATNAFSNGDFVQLAVVAAAYVIDFCFLWLAWAVLLAAPVRSTYLRVLREPTA